MPKKTNIRIKIALLLLLANIINYMDRSALAGVAPILTKELDLDAGEMGIVLSAFFWSYLLFLIPAGWYSDKVGQRKSLGLAVGWWSLATAAMALTKGFATVVVARIMMGIGESGAYPGATGAISKWFPDKERAKAAGIFDSGARIGTALALPVVIWLMTQFNWQVPFVVLGILGIIWMIVWVWYYRDIPEEHKSINQAEIDYIREGQLKKDGMSNTQPLKWYQLLRYRNIWAMTLGFFMLGYVIYFFATWFPMYLVQERGMDLKTVGFIAMIPPLIAVLAEILGGWYSDHLYSKGYSLTTARKVILVGGMLLATTIGVAGLVESIVMSIVLFSLAYSGLAIATAAIWSLPGDVAPENMSSVVAGIQNIGATLGGAVCPIVVGYIVKSSGSFVPALFILSGVSFLGALTYLFVLGKVEPINPEKLKNEEIGNIEKLA